MVKKAVENYICLEWGDPRKNAKKVSSNWKLNTINTNSLQWTRNIASSSVYITFLKTVTPGTHNNVVFRLFFRLPRRLALLGLVYLWYPKILLPQYRFVEKLLHVLMKYNTLAMVLNFYLQFYVVNLACDLCKGENSNKFIYFIYLILLQ
jgi:hypothetical protein